MSSKKDHKIWDAFLNHPRDYLKKKLLKYFMKSANPALFHTLREGSKRRIKKS